MILEDILTRMGKSRRNAVYKLPLPIKLVYDETEFWKSPFLENRPASLVLFGLFYFKELLRIGSSILRNYKEVLAQEPLSVLLEDGIFKVAVRVATPESCDALKLWRNGFFGKGVLSRSEPTWFQRTGRKLGLDKHYTEKDLTSEEITELRRAEKKKFKAVREAQEAEILKVEEDISKLIGEQNYGEEMVILRKKLENLKNTSLRVGDFRSFRVTHKVRLYEPKEEYLKEELEIIENGVLKQIEYMQLMGSEVLFLKQLGRVSVEEKGSGPVSFELLMEHVFGSTIVTLKKDNSKLLEAIVYHYYRSHGWCVRSGVKFGVDYLLYEKGPPISHAQYCVKIVERPLSLAEYSAVSRVVGSVRKTLLLAYVETPNDDEFEDWKKEPSWKSLLELYKIGEMVYKRWVPQRER